MRSLPTDERVVMTRAYTLSNEEYSALDKVIRGCRMDCWAIIAQEPDGNDYIYDIECGNHLDMKEGLFVISQGIGCAENLAYCKLSSLEIKALKILFRKFEITPDIWG